MSAVRANCSWQAEDVPFFKVPASCVQLAAAALAHQQVAEAPMSCCAPRGCGWPPYPVITISTSGFKHQVENSHFRALLSSVKMVFLRLALCFTSSGINGKPAHRAQQCCCACPTVTIGEVLAQLHAVCGSRLSTIESSISVMDGKPTTVIYQATCLQA